VIDVSGGVIDVSGGDSLHYHYKKIALEELPRTIEKLMSFSSSLSFY